MLKSVVMAPELEAHAAPRLAVCSSVLNDVYGRVLLRAFELATSSAHTSLCSPGVPSSTTIRDRPSQNAPLQRSHADGLNLLV